MFVDYRIRQSYSFFQTQPSFKILHLTFTFICHLNIYYLHIYPLHILHKSFTYTYHLHISFVFYIRLLFRCIHMLFKYICHLYTFVIFIRDMCHLFLSLRVFELLSLSLLLFSQRFGRYVLRPSSSRNVVEITIKMKITVRKPLVIKINKLRLRNLDN